jgi:hypothetical protein
MKYWASTDEMYPVWYVEEAKDDDPKWKSKYNTLIELTEEEKELIDSAWEIWTNAQKAISARVIAIDPDMRWAE